MGAERERKLEAALAQFIKPIRGIPFEVIVKATYGVEVIKFDPQDREEIVDRLVMAMRSAGQDVRRSPIVRPRPNEVGNDMEVFVARALNAEGLVTAGPKTKRGSGKSTGYPDLRIVHAPWPIYLEIKTYAFETHTTTQRSFYFSPADDPKVHEDAHHLAVGFEMVRNGNSFIPVAFEIVDLYGLDCDMKSEFNSDNRRLYKHDRLLASVCL